MKKQTKAQTKEVAQATQATQTKEVAQVKEVETVEQTILNNVAQLAKDDNLLRTQAVTGYTGIKYGNTTLVELHIKKKSISHITFSSASAVFNYAKENKCILRVVPKSYSWRLDTEVLCTQDNKKHCLHIVNEVINEHKNMLAKKQTKQAQAKQA